MNNYITNKAILMCFLSAIFYPSVLKASTDLPEILDYYPNCDYRLIDNYTVRARTEEPLAQKTTATLLQKLQQKAKSFDADAVILIAREIKKVINTDSYYNHSAANIAKFVVSYEAELIKNCEATNSNDKKAAPYNHQGYAVKEIAGQTSTIITKFEFTPPKKATLNHPLIESAELGLTHGIYGVKIGTTYEQVIQTFGDPSVVLKGIENEVILGYGRRLWLHFNSGKLVKAQSQFSSLSATLLNNIPLRDFFDDNPWTIAEKLTRKSSLALVYSVLKIQTPLINNELVLTTRYNTLTLKFSYHKSYESNSEQYLLDGFSLQSNRYEKSSGTVIDDRKSQFEALGLALSQLNQNENIDLDKLSDKLGQPLGRITLSASSYIDIYNPHLLIETKRNEISKIHLLEKLYAVNNDSNFPPWFFGHFIQGKSLKELRKHFPADYFELDNQVEIEKEFYTSTLFFDDNDDESRLYEIEIEVSQF